MARSDARPTRGLDVYLFPAVVGGGLGDIAEVLDAGRWLARAGFRPLLYRGLGRPWPRSFDRRWNLEGFRTVRRLPRRAARALTVSANWGVSAAPERREPLGRGGPWSWESREIESAYGPDRTVHVSLEEFARTLTSREETLERWREGGKSAREIRRFQGTARSRREARAFARAFRKFRAFARPNVLHLFAGFTPSSAFAREFPESLQVGPLWPPRPLRPTAPRKRRGWAWYASPSSSDRMVGPITEGLAGTSVAAVSVYGPRRFAVPTAWTWSDAEPATAWEREFGAAELRIVTGSRTLLEAIQLGGPFLYFNGILGVGRRVHRHRPEKIASLLRGWEAAGASPRHLRDLGDFSRGRRVREIVRAAATDPRWRSGFPTVSPVRGYPVGREDAGRFLVRVAEAFATGPLGATELVAAVRSDVRAPGAREE